MPLLTTLLRTKAQDDDDDIGGIQWSCHLLEWDSTTWYVTDQGASLPRTLTQIVNVLLTTLKNSEIKGTDGGRRKQRPGYFRLLNNITSGTCSVGFVLNISPFGQVQANLDKKSGFEGIFGQLTT